jgi:GTPase
MKPLPVVAILGFPNVGKSTLFNRFLGRKKALVHSLPGMTRDAVSALCDLGGKRFILTDTGGLEPDSGGDLGAAVTERAWAAARKADVVLFVLDAKREMSAAEEDLYASLRKLGRPVLVVLNKIDSGTQEARAGEYFNRLKAAEIHTISAEHLRNLDELETALVRLVPVPEASAEPSAPLRLAIIGRTNVGKSSIVNRLAGEERLIVSPAHGTTRDSTDTFVVRNGKIYCLVDTAGMRRLSRTRDEREQAGIIKAKKDIQRADVLCVVLDAGEFPTRQDATIAALADESGKPFLLALNKWDLIPKGESAQTLRNVIFDRLSFASYAPLLFVSAVSGKGVVKILDTAGEVHASGSRRVETPKLNKFLEETTAAHPPQTRDKREVKLRYMTQIGVLPPTFVVFASRPAVLLPAYERFFFQELRERFGFRGSPLRLLVRRSQGGGRPPSRRRKIS